MNPEHTPPAPVGKAREKGPRLHPAVLCRKQVTADVGRGDWA